MNSLNSFKGYDKMDPAGDHTLRRKTRTRLYLISAASILLFTIIATICTILFINKRHANNNNNLLSPQSPPLSTSSSIKSICSITLHPTSCYTSLSSAAAANSATISSDPSSIFNLSLSVASRALSDLPAFLSSLHIPISDNRLRAAVRDCRDLIDDAIDRIHESENLDPRVWSNRKIRDLKTWLSAIIADLESCLDGFEGTSGGVRETVESAMGNSTEFVSNSLAIVARVMGIMGKLHFPINRKLLEVGWRRRVLEGEMAANVTVAGDGSGDVKSVQEAVDLVPKKSLSLFVIRIKAGEYAEVVVVDKSKWNVVMIGDGMYKTIITSSKNFIDGTPTFSTATFAVTGRNFIAKDIGFKNTAGAEKHQAVALRSGSDHSIFYRCSFNGFQDTLYAHSNRQFYRDCEIAGTVDFIFGDAAVVFQNCKIMPRQPLPNQANTITAQGKKDPNEDTGISIQSCTIAPYDSVTRPTFLGRPWKNYSTTVIMKSEIGAVVDPAGWLSWLPGVVPPETINYAEYANTGPGSNVASRVTWPGFRPTIGPDEAAKYTVGSFIDGSEWISAAGVQVEPSM